MAMLNNQRVYNIYIHTHIIGLFKPNFLPAQRNFASHVVDQHVALARALPRAKDGGVASRRAPGQMGEKTSSHIGDIIYIYGLCME